MAYPTTAELVAASNVDALPTASTEDQDLYRLAAITAIEEYTGQQFGLDEPATVKRLAGNGTDVLYLPSRLRTLSGVSVSNSALQASDVVLGEKGDMLIVQADAAIGNYYTRTLRELAGNASLDWTYGDDTVLIEGDWGWDEPPENVVNALRRDMEDQAIADKSALSYTVRAFRKLGLRDAAQGNMRATILGSAGLSDQVRLLLEPYVWTGPVGAIV